MLTQTLVFFSPKHNHAVFMPNLDKTATIGHVTKSVM